MIGEFIGAVISEIVADLTAHQIEELIQQLLHGETLVALAHGGSQAASLLLDAMSQHQFAFEALSDHDWGELAELMQAA